MPLNDNNAPVAMKAMFKRLAFNDACYDKLVNKEGLSPLEKYQKCSADRCKDTIKALRYPGGNLASKLEKNHDDKFYLESFVPYKASDVKNDFFTKWDEFEAETCSIRGSTGISLSYLLRQTLIAKDEADDDEDDYATIDA